MVSIDCDVVQDVYKVWLGWLFDSDFCSIPARTDSPFGNLTLQSIGNLAVKNSATAGIVDRDLARAENFLWM